MTIEILQTIHIQGLIFKMLTKILLRNMVQIPFAIQDVVIQSCNLNLSKAI